MTITFEDGLAMEQIEQEDRHLLLQTEVQETEEQNQQHLLILSSNAVRAPSSPATSNLLISIGGTRDIALANSYSTHIFMDYALPRKSSGSILTTPSKSDTVTGREFLDTSVVAIDPNKCLPVDQTREEENHFLLQIEWILGHNQN
jgi:hypothetical protein